MNAVNLKRLSAGSTLRGEKLAVCLLAALVTACATTAVTGQQDAPPEDYFPTAVEQLEVDDDLIYWQPPRELWPAEPLDPAEKMLVPEKMEDPAERIQTRYRSTDESPEANRGGIFTDADGDVLYPADRAYVRPPQLWPTVREDAVGQPGVADVRYKDGVQLAQPIGDAPVSYAIPSPETHYPQVRDGETFYPVTRFEQDELFQQDVIGETSDAMWDPYLWEPLRAGNVYSRAPGLFQPIDNLLTGLSSGAAYDRTSARPPYFNPTAYNQSPYFRNEQFRNRWVTGPFGSYDFNRPGIRATVSNTYGGRRNLTYEGAIGADGSLGFIGDRSFYNRPVFVAGPLYIDRLDITTAAIYTNFNGELRDQFLEEGEDQPDLSGWIGLVQLDGNLAVRISENFYISSGFNVYYLIPDNEWGWGVGAGDLGLGMTPLAFLRVAYEFEAANWDWIAYDEFGAGLDDASLGYGYNDIGNDAITRVGRQSFGSDRNLRSGFGTNRNSNGFDLDTEDVIFYNTLGISGVGFITPNDWRGLATLERRDYWGEDTDDDRFESRENGDEWFGRFRVDYVDPAARWHPYAQYSFEAEGDFESVVNNVLAGVAGNLTANITLEANAGYSFVTGTREDAGDDDRFLANLHLLHVITRYTTHRVSVGQTWIDDQLGRDRWERYAQYDIDHILGPYTQIYGLARVSDSDEYGSGPVTDNRLTYAFEAGLLHDIGTRITAQASVRYFYSDALYDSTGDERGWIYTASATSEVAPDLYLRLLYRYITQSSDNIFEDFDEHLFLVSLTKTFD